MRDIILSFGLNPSVYFFTYTNKVFQIVIKFKKLVKKYLENFKSKLACKGADLADFGFPCKLFMDCYMVYSVFLNLINLKINKTTTFGYF